MAQGAELAHHVGKMLGQQMSGFEVELQPIDQLWVQINMVPAIQLNLFFFITGTIQNGGSGCSKVA